MVSAFPAAMPKPARPKAAPGGGENATLLRLQMLDWKRSAPPRKDYSSPKPARPKAAPGGGENATLLRLQMLDWKRSAPPLAPDLLTVIFSTAEKPGHRRGFEPLAGRDERPGRIERTPAQRSDPGRSEAGRGREAGRGGSEKGGGSGQLQLFDFPLLNFSFFFNC